MTDTPLDQFAAEIAQEGGLKLWSVIVTILGDLLSGSEARMPGPVLSALIAGMGLQPQAMRVALHRLKRDGWVESERVGRVGQYRLSEMGRLQTEAVGERVYGAATFEKHRWQMVVLPPDVSDLASELPEDMPCIMLSRRVFLIGSGDVPEGWFAASIDTMVEPPWVKALIKDQACAAAYTKLETQLRKLDPSAWPQDILGRTVLRILVLHAWRRLVLRANPLAEALLGPDAPPAHCRMQVLRLLKGLPRPDIKALSQL